MDTFQHRPDIPFIDRVKLQAEVLVPFIKRLEDDLGKDRARQLVRDALAECTETWPVPLGRNGDRLGH